MNNSDIANTLADRHGLTKTQARTIVDDVFSVIADAAAENDVISIAGFGKFGVKTMAARTGRNPATGTQIEIAASRKVAFTAAKMLKEKVNV